MEKTKQKIKRENEEVEVARVKEKIELSKAVTKIARVKLVSIEKVTEKEEKEKLSLVKEMRRRFEKTEVVERPEKDKIRGKVGKIVKKLEGATSQKVRSVPRNERGEGIKTEKIIPVSTLEQNGENLKIPEFITFKNGDIKRAKKQNVFDLTNNLLFRTQHVLNRSNENGGGVFVRQECLGTAVPSTRRPDLAGDGSGGGVDGSETR